MQVGSAYHAVKEYETKSSLVGRSDFTIWGATRILVRGALMIPAYLIEPIGSVAACLTTFAFLPQVVKLWQSRSVNDISLVSYSALSLGVFLWFVYGLGIGSLPVIVANGITFVLSTFILIMKIIFRR